MLIVDPADPKLITIEGTMQWCTELGIDPSSVRPHLLLPKLFLMRAGFSFILPSNRFRIKSNRRMGEGTIRTRMGSYAWRVSPPLEC
jgi:hypothetical protein